MISPGDEPTGAWTPEDPEAAGTRMPDFGCAFFARLFAEFPGARREVVFRRWSAQPADVYAFFGGLVIQIDPDLELVIVSGGDSRAECGDWGDGDRTEEALARIRALLGDDSEG